MRATLAAVLAAITIPSMAYAGPSDRGGTDREQARRLVELGDERFAAGDYAAALSAYRGADLIMGVPSTGLQLARAQMALSDLVGARLTLRRVVNHPSLPGEPEAFVHARTEGARLATVLESEIPTLTVQVDRASESHWITVDGRSWAAAQLGRPEPLNPGRHEITSGGADRQRVSRTVELKRGEHAVVRLTMPGASDTRTPTALLFAGFGVAATGVVVGSITSALSLGRVGEIDDQCLEGRGCPKSAEEARQESLTLTHVSTTSFAIAGAASLLGFVGLALVIQDTPSATHTMRLRTVVGPTSAALQLSF